MVRKPGRLSEATLCVGQSRVKSSRPFGGAKRATVLAKAELGGSRTKDQVSGDGALVSLRDWYRYRKTDGGGRGDQKV